MTNTNRRVLLESIALACAGYVVAVTFEAAWIRVLQPSEWELASLSDAVLAVALGIALYLWRHLLATRQELAERERTELVLDTQLRLAAEIQQRLLPTVPPVADGIEFAAALRSAGKIGGDYYDFVKVDPGMWLILVADVSGKGVPAAMALGSLRSTFRALARQTRVPAELMTQLSANMYHEWSGSPYVTCILSMLDLNTGRLTYTNAGHPPGLLAGSTGTRSLARGGLPAGLLPDVRFDQEEMPFRSGDVCLLVSDGVTEGMDAGAELEQELTALCARRNTSAADICQAVMARALVGPGPAGVEHWDDDRTVVVARIEGSL
jgi:sigma-B regulation protein RsbU (phosphoserine phosphatase)